MMKTRAFLFALALAACSSEANAPEPASSVASAILPRDASNAPSQLVVTERDPAISPSDVDTCATCHTDVAEQWKTSAHFFASFNNPIYRASVLRFRKENGNEKSRFCGGCHDPSLMVDGAMDHEIAPDDLRAFSGVTCRTCHGATHARADGNASLDLRIADIELPKNGDAASVERHKRAATPSALRTTGLCVSCHRVFLDEGSGNSHHLAGQDDGSPWARSVYAGSRAERVDENVAPRDCRGCHMQTEAATLGDAAAKNGRIASHRFLGAHTWLASMRGDADQIARVQSFMRASVAIDVVGAVVEDKRVLLPSDASVAAGDRVVVDVVIQNTGVGHKFPGGTLDAQDTWLELRAFDARHRLVAHAGDSDSSTFAPSTHRLRAVILDDRGEPVLARETERFRVTLADRTIAPRDAQVVEYALDLPANFDARALPLHFEAKLRHRSRSASVQAATCEHEKTDECRAFDAGLSKNYAFIVKPLDACAAEPITELAEASSELGRGASARDTSKDFSRSYAWSQGLLHVLSERLDEGRVPLAIAESSAHTPTERAMALSLLGQLAAKQGRVDEAFAHLEDAESAIGAHPFFDRVRGEVLASTWRESEAIPFFSAAANVTRRDDALLSELAVTLGSASKHAAALEAARYALALQPRDEAALRVQALSLESLGAPATDVRLAKDAWLVRRTLDDGSAIKGRCSAKIPGCAAERDPVRLHPMIVH